jgi:transposase-like protein
MAPSKLAPADKEEMVRLYRETPASFSFLSKQFGISVSTVSRLLQEAIPEEEYRRLVSHKQTIRPKRSKSSNTLESGLAESAPMFTPPAVQPEVASTSAQLDLSSPFPQPEVPPEVLVEEIMEDLGTIDGEFPAYEEEVEELEELEDPAEEDEDLEPEEELDSVTIPLNTVVSVLPLSEAVFPDPCYMVVDKAHEIVTRPLKAFKDLGIIPDEESQSITLPIFHNHRVVRRFCNPHQLIVKFSPHLIYAAKAKLEQKGITRLLLDGQVYALS